MALFKYEALSADGKKIQGTVNADSMDLAKDLLRKKRIFVTNLFDAKAKSSKNELSPAIVLSFTRDLAQLLKAGLPLYESLLAIEEKYRHSKYHSVFLDLCDKVKHGMQLSKALAYYPQSFDQIYVAMVTSAEETGSLPDIFHHLDKLITRQQKLKKQITSAMIYPIFLLCFCFIVTAALFFFLIPSMQQLFEGRALHPLTQTILNISQFLNKNALKLALGVLGCGILCAFILKLESTKLQIRKLLLKTPVIKKLITASVLVRFTRALGVMLSSSVAMIEALKLSKKIMKNDLFERIITKAEFKIMQGGKLSEELSKSILFPALVIRMISIAEETGKLSEMLFNISEIYEEELEKSLSRLTSMLQPVVLLFLAIVVGVVILSILLPLTDVGSFLN